MSTDFSGVMVRWLPSTWLWNATPSSAMVRSPSSEKTWNPPLSVSIGRFQWEKACSPPSERTTSSPGRRCR